MGKVDLVGETDFIPPADSLSGGGPLADAVDGQNGSGFERRNQESAGGVGQVVRNKNDVAIPV